MIACKIRSKTLVLHEIDMVDLGAAWILRGTFIKLSIVHIESRNYLGIANHTYLLAEGSETNYLYSQIKDCFQAHGYGCTLTIWV